MRILVTGSEGLIGKAVVAACQKRWPLATVIGWDRAVHWESGDCRDYFRYSHDTIELAFHCAAITGGIEGTTGNPAGLAAINAQLDGAFFEWALKTNPRRIVYFSSSCAYPLLQTYVTRQLRESEIDYTRHADGSTYGAVKLVGEVIANSVREAGVPVSVVRPFAVYGEHQETWRMIPKFIERALTDSETFEVWGPGDQASDFIHVDDAVNAILTMVDQDIDGPVNLGTGIGTTVDEAARMVMNAAGIDRPIVHNLDKPAGPRWRVADPTLLETFYKPTISLEEGIQRALYAKAVPLSFGPGDDLA